LLKNLAGPGQRRISRNLTSGKVQDCEGAGFSVGGIGMVDVPDFLT
jgi:hypothetical protein